MCPFRKAQTVPFALIFFDQLKEKGYENGSEKIKKF